MLDHLNSVDQRYQSVCANFDDFDRIMESRSDWDMDVRQLERGVLKASVKQLQCENFSLSRSEYNRKAYNQGAPGSGMRSFGLIGGASPGFDWCGREINTERLVMFPSGGDFRTITPAGFCGYNLAFKEEELSASCLRLGVPDVCETLPIHGEVFLADPRSAEALRHAMSCMLDTWCHAEKSPAWREPLLGVAGGEVADRLVLLLTNAEILNKTPRNNRLTAVANQTLQFIEEHLEDGVSVADVVKATGINTRTLQYAFHSQFGISPKAFINEQRLALVRRELLTASPGIKVSDAANRWGYWHLGQFARDYRNRFGELPSQTSSR